MKSAPEQDRSELICIGCGYDLRATAVDGRCPECGMEVERSLHGHWLRYSDQRWVETMLRGVNWIWTSMGILVGVVLLVAIWGILFFFVIDPSVNHPVLDPMMRASVAVEVVGLVAVCIGIVGGLWMFTVPEPRREGTEPNRMLLLRLLTIALIVACGTTTLRMWRLGSPAPLLPWWEAVPQLAIPLIIGIHAYLLLEHARSIERRCCGFDDVREKHLRKYRRTIMGFAIACTIAAILPYLAVGVVLGPGMMMSLPWLAAISQLGETRNRMRAELAMSTAAEKIEAAPKT